MGNSPGSPAYGVGDKDEDTFSDTYEDVADEPWDALSSVEKEAQAIVEELKAALIDVTISPPNFRSTWDKPDDAEPTLVVSSDRSLCPALAVEENAA